MLRTSSGVSRLHPSSPLQVSINDLFNESIGLEAGSDTDWSWEKKKNRTDGHRALEWGLSGRRGNTEANLLGQVNSSPCIETPRTSTGTLCTESQYYWDKHHWVLLAEIFSTQNIIHAESAYKINAWSRSVGNGHAFIKLNISGDKEMQ